MAAEEQEDTDAGARGEAGEEGRPGKTAVEDAGGLCQEKRVNPEDNVRIENGEFKRFFAIFFFSSRRTFSLEGLRFMSSAFSSSYRSSSFQLKPIFHLSSLFTLSVSGAAALSATSSISSISKCHACQLR